MVAAFGWQLELGMLAKLGSTRLGSARSQPSVRLARLATAKPIAELEPELELDPEPEKAETRRLSGKPSAAELAKLGSPLPGRRCGSSKLLQRLASSLWPRDSSFWPLAVASRL